MSRADSFIALTTPPRSASSRAAVVHAWIDSRLAASVSASDDVHILLELGGAVIARDRESAIGERLLAALESSAFEDEVRRGPDMASLRLRRLAALRVRLHASALAEDRRAAAGAILRRLEALIHDDAARSSNPQPSRARSIAASLA